MKYSSIAMLGTMIMTVIVVLKCDECHPLNYARCNTDGDCPEKMYCPIRPPICACCINCTVYNRLNGVVRCVKDANYCGPCLPGFFLGIDTLTCIEKFDVKQPFAHKMENTGDSTTFVKHDLIDPILWLHPLWFLCGIVVLIFIVLVISAYTGRRFIYSHNEDSSTEQSLPFGSGTVTTPPPPYESCVPATLDMVERASITGVRAFNLNVQENADNDKQKAVPFLQPAYGHQNYNGYGNATVDNENDHHAAATNEEIPRQANNEIQLNVVDQPNPQTHSSNSSVSSDLSPYTSAEEEEDCNTNAEDADEELASPPVKRKKGNGDNNNEYDTTDSEDSARVVFVIGQEVNSQ